jgi:hypothetical protein
MGLGLAAGLGLAFGLGLAAKLGLVETGLALLAVGGEDAVIGED